MKNLKEKINEKMPCSVATFMGISIIAFIFVCLYMKITKYIYFWDTLGYWEYSLDTIQHFQQSFIVGIRKIIYTALFSDYGYLAAILPSIIMVIFGKSRTIYSLAITVVYMIPSLYMILLTVNKIANKSTQKKKAIIYFISIMTIFPLLLYLNFFGYVDLGGIFLAFLAIYLYIGTKKKDTLKLASIGIVLMIMFFFRRWYMFFVVSFLVANFIGELFIILYKKEYKKIKDLIIKFLKIGVPMLIVVAITVLGAWLLYKNDDVFVLDWKNFYMYKLLFVDYSQVYSAYQNTLFYDLGIFLGNYGLIPLAFIIGEVIYLNIKKKDRYFANVAALQFVLCLMLFLHTQSHDRQHLLLYMPSIIFINILFFKNIENKKIIITLGSIIVINQFLLLPCFNDVGIVKMLKENHIVQKLNMKPVVRNDIEQLGEIKNTIEELSENGTKKVYINSSSMVINDAIIKSYDKSMGINYDNKDYILGTSHSDARDGIPIQIKEADFVVVTNPAQLHLGEKNQKVILYVNDTFIENHTIAQSYQLEKEMTLNDISILIYKKTKEITDEDMEKFINEGESIITNGGN